MSNLTAIDAVLQHQIEGPPSDVLPPVHGAIWPNAAFAPYPRACKLFLERTDRLEGKITPVDVDHDRGLRVIDHQLAVFHVVPKRRHAAHPHSLSFGGGNLVAHTLANDLAFKLSE